MSRLEIRSLDPTEADALKRFAPQEADFAGMVDFPVTTCAVEGENLLGVASVGNSEWDTRYFRFPVGRVVSFSPNREDAALALARCLTERAEAERWRLVIARIPAGDVLSINALQAEGFEYRETTLIARIDLAALSDDVEPPNMRPAVPEDEARVHAIARLAFRTDHFHRDRRFDPGLADGVYVCWASQWFTQGGDTRRMLVRERDGEIVGFVGIQLKPPLNGQGPECEIALLAVHPVSQHQGIGHELLTAALAEAKRAGAAMARTRVTSANVPGMALYQEAGFRLGEPEVTLHRWWEK